MVKELAVSQCSNKCPEVMFDCKTSEDLSPLEEIIGQDRAVRALHYGLRMEDQGFNVYISGVPGTGRKTAIVDFIKELSKSKPVPKDYCYVNNFQDNSKPKWIGLPPGTGKQLKREMELFTQGLIKALQKGFEGEDYSKRRDATIKLIDTEREALMAQANKMANDAGFVLTPSPVGLNVIPMAEGRPLTQEEFEQLPIVLQKEISMKREEVEEKIRTFLRPLRDLARKADEGLMQLNREVGDLALDPLLEKVRELFKGNADVENYLKEVETDVLNNLPLLLIPQQQAPGVPMIPIDPMKGYHVNLIVDNSETKGAPTVIETNPTYSHLFGYTEKEVRFGALITDFMMIRAGSVHRANGGFIVIEAERLLADPFAYQALKQTIQGKKLVIEDPAVRFEMFVTKSMRPQAIPFECKVLLMGSPQTYDILYSLDQEFRELFKVRADFDTVMERTQDNITKYASFVCTLCKKESIMHLDPKALAAVIDYSSRLSEDKNKLSTQFSAVADLIREANYYAKVDGAKVIGKEHILKQLEEKEYRSNMIQDKIKDMILDGTVLIDTEGSVVGQVNGLAVLQIGDYAFGRPSRITASVGVGREGIMDIERQAQMGGPTHTKGVMILAGYLNWMYAQKTPLGLTARLVFEQSYSGVDGDSASSTELYAILSALSGKPIRQDLAVTGSVNQRGQVQAIGGVNQKIEGFFEVCKAKGLTGTQGCMIPASNVQHLMLKQVVLDAIAEGKFHIYPISTIDEGIETLTGTLAGVREADGKFPEGSIHYLAQKQITAMAESIKEFRM